MTLFEYTHRADQIVPIFGTDEANRLLDQRDLDLEEYLHSHGCGQFEYTHRWPVLAFSLAFDEPEGIRLLEEHDRELEVWFFEGCGPFEYTVRWAQIPLDDPLEMVRLLEDRDRELEARLEDCSCGAVFPDRFVFNYFGQYADLGLLSDSSTGLSGQLSGAAFSGEFLQCWNDTTSDPDPLLISTQQGLYRSDTALPGEWTFADASLITDWTLLPNGPQAGTPSKAYASRLSTVIPGVWDDYLLAPTVVNWAGGPANPGDDPIMSYTRAAAGQFPVSPHWTETHLTHALYDQFPYPSQIQYLSTDFVITPQVSAMAGNSITSVRWSFFPGFGDSPAFGDLFMVWLSCDFTGGGVALRTDGDFYHWGFDSTNNKFLGFGRPDDGSLSGVPVFQTYLATSSTGTNYAAVEPFPSGASFRCGLHIPTIGRTLAWFSNGDVKYSDDGGASWTTETATQVPAGDSRAIPWNVDHGFAVIHQLNGNVYTTEDGLTWDVRYVGSGLGRVAVGP